MKNFTLGLLSCLCVVLLVIQSYMLFCPHFQKERDIHITNQMILPYDGFALRPFRTGPVFPHNNFPFILQEKDESLNKDKDVHGKFVE